ncbi:hypothetical protein ScalyP_jg7095 [Parmales sp. scaly parma]|nr:hypothetical protein ScalyP_jg7095 [Parmales sp. scaly parma]
MSLRQALAQSKAASEAANAPPPSPPAASAPKKKKAPAKKKKAPVKKKPAAKKTAKKKTQKVILESDDDDIDFSDEDSNPPPPILNSISISNSNTNEDMEFSDASDDEPQTAASAFNDAVSSDEDSLNDSDSSEEEEMGGNYIKDAEDQTYLNGLSEMEREAILAQRYEDQKTQQELKKLKRENKQKARDLKYGSKPSSSRRSTRNKDVDSKKKKKMDSMAELKARKNKKTADYRSDDDDDIDYDSESDNDDDFGVKSKKKKKKGKQTKGRLDEDDPYEEEEALPSSAHPSSPFEGKASPPATTEQIQAIVVSRNRLMKWCNEPYFEAAVVGCYVKLSIGMDQNTQKMCFRLCEIAGVEQFDNYYQFTRGAKGKDDVQTNRRLLIKFGPDEKIVKMDMISNSALEENDVLKLNRHLENNRIEKMTQRTCKKLTKTKMNNIVDNYQYKPEVIAQMIAESKKMDPKNVSNIGLQKGVLELKIEDIYRVRAENAEKVTDLVREFGPSVKSGETDPNGMNYSNDNSSDDDDDDDHDNNDKKVAQRFYREAENYLKSSQFELEKLEGELARVCKAEEARLNKFRKNNVGWSSINDRAYQSNQNTDFDFVEKPPKEDEGFNPFKRRPNKPQVLWSVEIEGKEEQERIKKANEEEKLKLEREEGERVEREKAALAEGGEGEGGGAGEGGDIVVFDVLASKKTDGVGVVGGGGSAAPRQRTGMSLTDYLAKKQ